MNGNQWIAVLVAIAAIAATPAPADACIGPSEMQRLEATAPAPDAIGVSLTPLIVAQFLPEQGYPGESELFGDSSAPLTLSLTDAATGEVLEAVEVEFQGAWEGSGRAAVVHPVTLQPNTVYVATLQQDTTYEWTFTTGDGEVEPFAPAPTFEMNLDAYFAEDAQYSCCPIEFPGECPRCFLVRYLPLPTISAGFDLLPHPAGPGAFVYTLQHRANVADAGWGDVTTGSFSTDFGRLLYERASVNDDLCFRVLARSVIEPMMEYESNELCRNGADHFSDPPDLGPYDSSQVMCGDETVDDTDPDDPDDIDDDVVDDDGGDDGVDDDQDGWEVSEDGTAKASDSGCGCSSTRDGQLPASILLLAIFFGARRRRGLVR